MFKTLAVKNLVILRDCAGLSQEDMAVAIGISNKTYNTLENWFSLSEKDKEHFPRKGTVKQVAEYFGLEVIEIPELKKIEEERVERLLAQKGIKIINEQSSNNK